MHPKPLEVTRTSLTTCYTSLRDSSRRNTYSLNKGLLIKYWWLVKCRWCLTSISWTPSTSLPSTSHILKFNAVSLRHKHSPKTLFILRIQFMYYVPAFICNARQFISHVKSILSTKILFLKILFFQNFVSFYLILFYFI